VRKTIDKLLYRAKMVVPTPTAQPRRITEKICFIFRS